MVTVLVVDDYSEIRDVIHVYLRNEGYSVLEAADGLEALDGLKTSSVQLVILDVMMPRGYPLQFLKEKAAGFAAIRLRRYEDALRVILTNLNRNLILYFGN